MIKLTISVIAMTVIALAGAGIAAAQTSPTAAVKKNAIPMAAQSNAHAVVASVAAVAAASAAPQNSSTSPVKAVSMRGHNVVQNVMVAPTVGIKPDTQPK